MPYRRLIAVSSYHIDQVFESKICGCYSCCEKFKPWEISEWIDEGNGTALCPICGMDTVIPSALQYPITRKFLKAAHKYWFEQRREPGDLNL